MNIFLSFSVVSFFFFCKASVNIPIIISDEQAFVLPLWPSLSQWKEKTENSRVFSLCALLNRLGWNWHFAVFFLEGVKEMSVWLSLFSLSSSRRLEIIPNLILSCQEMKRWRTLTSKSTFWSWLPYWMLGMFSWKTHSMTIKRNWLTAKGIPWPQILNGAVL